MEGPEDRWQDIRVHVFKDLNSPDRYRVEFLPSRLMQSVRPGEEYPRVPEEARVIVEGDREGLRINYFYPPEHPIPHLSRDDYEAKALESVREHLGQG